MRAMVAAMVLVAVIAGLPWLFLMLAGSPIPDHLPGWDEIVAALSSRDDGTLLLGVVKYLAWIMWTIWTAPIMLEAFAHVSGRSAPRIPGLRGPQRFATLLVTSLGAAVIGTTTSISRATTLPPPPPDIAAIKASPQAPPDTHGARAFPPQAEDVRLATSAGGAERPKGESAVPARMVRPEQRTRVQFDFDTAEPSPSVRNALTRVARDIGDRGDPTYPVLVVGHSDSLGPAAYNQRLSLQRARSVRNLLGQILSDRYRFEVSGKGETAPLAAETRPGHDDDPTARARNRRVEITYTLARPGAPHPSPSSPGQRQPGENDGAAPAPSATPPSPAPPQPSSISPSGAMSPVPAPDPPATISPSHSPTIINLPSGAVVGLSFAAGVGTALLVTRLHRRRRHRTPRTGPDLTIAEPEPKPTVRKLRRADLAARESDRSDPAEASDRDRLHLFPVASSGMIVAGVRDDVEITVPIGGLVLGLTGPGAEAAARALLLALLTHAGDHDVEIVIPRVDAASLFSLSRDDVDEVAEYVRALTVTADVDAAIRLLESERIHRARLLDTTDSQDLAAVRVADPTEPLPRLVLAARPGDEHRRRLEALCGAADVYDMAALIFGQYPPGPTLDIDYDGRVTTAGGAGTQRWEGARLFHLAVDDADEVFDVIRSAHGAPEGEPFAPPESQRHAPVPPPPPQEAGGVPARLAHLRVLGPPTLFVDGTELATGIRGKSRELLTFLAVHADGAPRDKILTALWPEVDQRHAVMRFHAALNDVRRELRRASATNESFIVVAAERYRIDPELVSVDLWQFRTALHQAAHADDIRVRAGLLQEAADAYTGDLAAEQAYKQSLEWIEPEREALRRQAVEALIHLAELREHDEPERGLVALERARTLDHYAEETYQRIMVLQARLGRPDAVRRTHRLLETALEELGVDPSQETQQLLWRLLHPRGQP
jgi:outer membrane protein OmpA-like peptidoglycan-associated protein/DNA-binding SARP family transcriptional activator